MVVFGVTRFVGDAEPMFKLADAIQSQGITLEHPKVISTAKVRQFASLDLSHLLHLGSDRQVPRCSESS